jgi:hypothetical protein
MTLIERQAVTQQIAAGTTSRRALPVDEWVDTGDAVHMWTPVVGKTASSTRRAHRFWRRLLQTNRRNQNRAREEALLHREAQTRHRPTRRPRPHRKESPA